MKEMFFGAVLAAVFAVSCGIEEVSRRPQGGAGSVWTGPGMNAGAGMPDKTVTYITAVDYPDGYDWRADREKGSVKCSLVVYADGIPMMKVPVGDKYETSSDVDMHRMVNGHLYTDYSTETETVIRKDGKEIIRYEGREMICDLIEKDGEVFTLGHDRDGDGFTCRRDGRVVVGRDCGRSYGRFDHGKDSVIFAFCESVEAVDETYERYYYSVNGQVFQTAVRDDVKTVWDIVFLDGKIYYLATVVGIAYPVIVSPEGMTALNRFSRGKLLTCRFIPADGTLSVEGLLMYNDEPLTSCIWDRKGKEFTFDYGMTLAAVCKSGDGVNSILNTYSKAGKGQIYRGREKFTMPSGYISMGSSPAVSVDGILHVGLSSLSGAAPLVWKDGETTPIGINGFISTISTNKK